MEGTIRKIGNSNGLIIPKGLVEKYGLGKVIIEDTGEGILIRPAELSLFEQKLQEARRNKKEIYNEMRKQAEDCTIQDYYASSDNNLSEVDTDIIKE